MWLKNNIETIDGTEISTNISDYMCVETTNYQLVSVLYVHQMGIYVPNCTSRLTLVKSVNLATLFNEALDVSLVPCQIKTCSQNNLTTRKKLYPS